MAEDETLSQHMLAKQRNFGKTESDKFLISKMKDLLLLISICIQYLMNVVHLLYLFPYSRSQKYS